MLGSTCPSLPALGICTCGHPSSLSHQTPAIKCAWIPSYCCLTGCATTAGSQPPLSACKWRRPAPKGITQAGAGPESVPKHCFSSSIPASHCTKHGRSHPRQVGQLSFKLWILTDPSLPHPDFHMEQATCWYQTKDSCSTRPKVSRPRGGGVNVE